MKEKRIDYLVDNFVDNYGDSRYFVICAVSYEFNEESVDVVNNSCGCNMIEDAEKCVKLGYSFCRPEYTDKNGNVHKDEFNVELGKRIALGRARVNSNYALIASYAGDINSDVVKALLERRAKYFKNNPGSMIAGYERKKKNC